jgi:hypothetical protein
MADMLLAVGYLVGMESILLQNVHCDTRLTSAVLHSCANLGKNLPVMLLHRIFAHLLCIITATCFGLVYRPSSGNRIHKNANTYTAK